MLHFESFGELSAFTTSLESKEADIAQLSSAYTALGINVNAETLPNLTDHPVCLTTETAIGSYTSARKAEEAVINAALDQGDDNINSIIIRPYWKTALNADRAVHIGQRIYKYYDHGGMAIVLNDDWMLYDAIKALPFESLRQSYNLIVTSDARNDWDKYFTFNADGSINAAKQIFLPRFMAVQAADGKRGIVNISLVESKAGAATFTWTYSNNTTSVGQNPTMTIGQNEGLTVTINNGSGTTTTLTGAEAILICSTDNFTITNLTPNQIRFELPGYNATTSPYNIKWVFSDGSTSTSNPVVKTFSSNGTATCQLFWKHNGQLGCQFTKSFFVNCGDKKGVNQTIIRTVSGQKWKLDCSIWVQSGEVGCKTKYLKRVGFLWLPANNQGACSDISGTYRRQVDGCTTVFGSGSKCLGNGTFPTSVSFTIPEINNVFVDPGNLSSGHKIQVSGTWFGLGVGGVPRLVLN